VQLTNWRRLLQIGLIMKNLKYLLFVQLLSADVFAVEIPNEFQDGQVTSASQMNENFQALKVEIEILKTQIEENQGSQIAFVGVTEEKFNGSAGLVEMGKACNRMVAGSHICGHTQMMAILIPENISISDAWLLNSSTYGPLNCNIFRDIFGNSWGINNNGYITKEMPCHSQIGVACCK
jgi:hypothetical protein